LRTWIAAPPADPPTVGGFLFVTVASIGVGLTVSTLRWLLIDTLHHRTGLRPPAWDFSLLGDRVAAFEVIVDNYYRFYQFYSGMVISLAVVFVARRWSLGFLTAPPALPDLGLAALEGCSSPARATRCGGTTAEAVSSS